MKLRRRDHHVPELNMASMPDLIFTVLFFFMIVTHMREDTVNVSYQQPEGTQLVKVGNKAAIIRIYIGKAEHSDNYQVQVGKNVTPFDGVAAEVLAELEHISPELQEETTISLQADKEVPMYLINKVKQSLRDVGVLKINYNATEKSVPNPKIAKSLNH